MSVDLPLGTQVGRVRRARLTDGRLTDVRLDGGLITAVGPAPNPPSSRVEHGAVLDLGGRLLLPAFVEPHAHLDKALLTLPGTRPGLRAAVDAWVERYPERTVEEITARALRAAREYVRHGVGTIRTHADAGPLIGTRAVEASAAVRRALREVLEIQVVAMTGVPLTGVTGAAARAGAVAALDAGADLLGGAPWLDPEPDAAVAFLVGLAADRGVDLDLHLDETTDPAVQTWPALLSAVRGRLTRSVTISHAVSLGSLDRPGQVAAASRLADAGIAVVTLPRTSLWLQERPVRTGPRRGLTAVRTLLDAGVTLAAGTDNLRDVFNPYGNADPLDVARLLATVAEVSSAEALDAVTGGAALVVDRGLRAAVEVGARADLVVVGTDDTEQALALAPAGRLVLHGGRVVARRMLVEEDLAGLHGCGEGGGRGAGTLAR